MDRPRFSPSERALLIGVPVVWALLLLLHPVGDGDFYDVVKDDVTAWQTVHVGMMVFIPLFAATVWLLLRRIEGTLAQLSRIALAVFVVVYGAFELLVGVGTGILTDEVNALPAGEREAGSDLIQSYVKSSPIEVFELVGSIALLVALVTAGLALVREAGASRWVAVLLFVGAVPIAFHVPPFGQFGLALFLGAVLLTLRAESPSATAAGAPQPGPA